MFTVLVCGGSQGAHKLNTVCAAALCRLRDRGEEIQVVHLTGEADESITLSMYRQHGVECVVMSFLNEMDRAYTGADMAICRAGAATCMELAAFGVPAVLVPLAHAIGNHQKANAESLARATGVKIVDEQRLSEETVMSLIMEWKNSPGLPARIGEDLKGHAVTDGADRLADLVLSSVRE